MANISYEYLSNIKLKDPFFDSLKEDYQRFTEWFMKKSDEGKAVFTFYIHNNLNAFLFLKFEDEEHTDIAPSLPQKRRLKVGTFKIDAHGTKLGERFIKKIFDVAIENGIEEVYVTIFPKHLGLISLLTTFGFHKHGIKSTSDGIEDVYIKRFNHLVGDILLDYPIVKFTDVKKHVLSIYPKFHTQLFPESILNNENYDLLNDCSPTNSIHKMYICAMDGVLNFQKGDLIAIYRSSDGKGPAKYRSVVTSVCTVEEVVHMNEFNDEAEYMEYCKPYSIFKDLELKNFYKTKKYPYIIKMIYNIAFKKRVINDYLANTLMIRPQYWGVFPVSDDNFLKICREGRINEELLYME